MREIPAAELRHIDNHPRIKLKIFRFLQNEIFKRPYYENATFYNHTECHCVAKSSAPERNPSPPAPMQVPICNCPRHFQSHFDEDNNCWCQCPPRQHSYEKGICEALTEGEGFSIEDRRFVNLNVLK